MIADTHDPGTDHSAPDDTTSDDATFDDTGMTDDEKRHDQLTRASGSTEQDAAPRITTSAGTNGATRIDVADTAVVRPGDPEEQRP